MLQFHIFILFRVLHRIYYMLTGHRHYLRYKPRDEMDKFIAANVVTSSIHEFKCSRDKVLLRYRRLGNGKKVVLLCNGVGTGFFMWLPIFQELVKLNKNIWSEITLIAPEYRGLFGSVAENSKDDVDITTDECVEDIREVMTHAKIDSFYMAMGWSLEFGAFFGGFPPEQPVYFHEYMRDTFQSCDHTRSLLDLILSLDGDIPKEAHSLPHQTVIISGIPDVMTGVYHSQALARTMPNVKHVTFTMGSHFLLMEWPNLVTKEICNLIQE